MIILRNLQLAFGSQPVFNNVSLSIAGDEKIGLFGLNGAGKSTMLKAIAGQQQLDDGIISITKGFTVAYMPQEVTLASSLSIFDETMTAFKDLAKIEQKKDLLEKLLHESPDASSAIAEYAAICEKLVDLEPAKKRAQAQEMLLGLGFSALQLEQSVQTLSVGWKMRVVLAKLLLQDADFYLFDEPTNHLDIVAKEWFLRFLATSKAGFMLVCHEKRFLNALCTRILELERGVATLYSGNYDQYLAQKQDALVRLESAYQQQQKEIAHTKEIIAKFRAKASKASMAQSLIKKLEKIELITLPPTIPTINFNFAHVERAARLVVQIKNLTCSFGEKVIFKQVNFVVERGNKIAIVAANGVGKTTLLNCIIGKVPHKEGSIEIGSNVQIAVFDQDQTAALNMQATVLENARSAAKNATEQMVRATLGGFLFNSSAVNKKASVLSGGERNRLGMVRILLSPANLLLLDEPTNHLDIPSKDILLKALQSYTGTMIFVSHDQDFINHLATHIVELTPHGVTLYEGNYDSYLFHKEAVGGATHHDAASRTKQHGASGEKSLLASTEDRKKDARQLEQKINKLEQQKEKISLSFADLEWGTSAFDTALKKLDDIEKELVAANREWEKLTT